MRIHHAEVGSSVEHITSATVGLWYELCGLSFRTTVVHTSDRPDPLPFSSILNTVKDLQAYRFSPAELKYFSRENALRSYPRGNRRSPVAESDASGSPRSGPRPRVAPRCLYGQSGTQDKVVTMRDSRAYYDLCIGLGFQFNRGVRRPEGR